MKTSWTQFLRCLLIRRDLNRTVEGRRKLPARAEAHLSNCPRCRRWHAVQSRLIGDLRREARDADAEPSPQVRERIMNALAEAPAETPGARGFVRWAAGVSAAAMLIALTLLWIRHPAGDSPDFADLPPEVAVSPFASEYGEPPEMEYVRELERLIADGRATARFVLSSLPLDEDY